MFIIAHQKYLAQVFQFIIFQQQQLCPFVHSRVFISPRFFAIHCLVVLIQNVLGLNYCIVYVGFNTRNFNFILTKMHGNELSLNIYSFLKPVSRAWLWNKMQLKFWHEIWNKEEAKMAGASPAGGHRGHCPPPIFVFDPPIYFLPSHCIFS